MPENISYLYAQQRADASERLDAAQVHADLQMERLHVAQRFEDKLPKLGNLASFILGFISAEVLFHFLGFLK